MSQDIKRGPRRCLAVGLRCFLGASRPKAKTPTNYSNLCKNIGLDSGNGYVERSLAIFNFKK